MKINDKQDHFLISLVDEVVKLNRPAIVVLDTNLLSSFYNFVNFFLPQFEIAKVSKFQEFYEDSLNVFQLINNGFTTYNLKKYKNNINKLTLIDFESLFNYYPDNFDNYVNISVDQKIDINQIRLFLSKIGYICVDMVDYCGQFSIKGDILDIGMSVNYEMCGVRIAIDYENITSIDRFDLSSQRKFKSTLSNLLIPPVNKVVNSDINKDLFLDSFCKYFKDSSEIYNIIKNEMSVFNFDYFTKFIYKQISLFDLFDQNSIFILPAKFEFLVNKIWDGISNEYGLISSYKKALLPSDCYVDREIILSQLSKFEKIIY
jgi:transcription-repair coupling factor (superfamily II helicase)